MRDVMIKRLSTPQRIFAQLLDLSGALFAVALMLPHTAYAATVVTESVVVEDSVEDDAAGFIDTSPARPVPGAGTAIGKYGPFSVVGDMIVMNGAVETSTPAKFRALLAAHPGVKTIEMIECPGSEDDDANLALAKLIHAAGLNTHVPAGGSIRSGAVELFLAGTERTSERGAQFGVHSWRDDTGREARDYGDDDAVHTPYLRFYREIGFTPESAKAFYDFTNRASFDNIHYMTTDELTRYGVTTGRKQIATARLDY
jgi:hypothetical protein